MLDSFLLHINPFLPHISYETQQQNLLHLVCVFFIIILCFENMMFALFIFFIIYLYINKMSTKESYNGVKDIALAYPCIGNKTSPTPLYNKQTPLSVEQHNLLQQARNKITCTPTTTSEANYRWKHMNKQTPLYSSTNPVSYGDVQNEWNDLITLFNIEPCLQKGDSEAAVDRIQQLSGSLCQYIKDNHSGEINAVHKEYCKSENAIFKEHNEIGHPCPKPRSTPMFPDPAINPRAKIVTNELVKPYSATIFTQMEKNKNIGRPPHRSSPQMCKKECPKIDPQPKNYNEALKTQFNNNIKGHCFKKDFPSVNPTERNLSINPNTFYKNFIQHKPTTMGQRIQIENAIKEQSYKIFEEMNDSVIHSHRPVKQREFVGAFH